MKGTKFNTFSIGDTAKMAQVSLRQIRDWEARGYIPKAERTVCGERAYRRFSYQQIEIIQKIKEYQDEGFTLQAAARKARQVV
jgi:DNA-binding transcriptional MerR regulator